MIVVVDFGGQYAHLICKNIRDLGVYSELISPENTLKFIKNTYHLKKDRETKIGGIIFSGGPQSVNDCKLISIFNYC